MDEMKKDKILEEKFEEYFDGINPPYGLTNAAKQTAERKKRTRKGILKGLIPAVCAVVICAVFVVFFTNRGTGDYDKPTPPAVTYDYYALDDLVLSEINVYSNNVPKELKFASAFAYAENSAVNSASSYALNGKRALVKTEISSVGKGRRSDATIYAEFVNEIYEPLKDFAEGENCAYGNLNIKYSQTAEDGETVGNAYFVYGGVKYYLSVKSGDGNAVFDYIDAIVRS